MEKLSDLFLEISACKICEPELNLGARPVVVANAKARLMIIGQAPGTKVHATGIPWNDPSGDRLREWLQLDKDQFYNEENIAIMPMGFCYPGKIPKGGDKPPRLECAPQWHERLKAQLPNIGLTLLVGSYAQKYYLGKEMQKTMTETIRHYEDYLDRGFLPLPHPSWRTTGWLKKNPWFDEEVLPFLRQKTKAFLN
ncbi:uracil-DNA glycosylase family protein [Curvivirga aplysinae]|uniref:uracil-DNA glycosylase family protein n=1 Tax=Curvivirga aplysinae TaxID=2529852 RepID=UPI0012BC85C4|nr:uracil-DNA glycosylase family protein [Curvivirga aplysinae]MTI09785.1 uracil-DNA glycosylase family protein [Curvivirga aplysinae]